MQSTVWPRFLIGVTLTAILAVSARSDTVYAQNATADLVIRGPITALRVDANRLLIGQGSLLIIAHVSDNGLSVTETIDLHRHDLRAFAVDHGVILALSEDGLTTQDSSGTVLDFVPGGGQTLAV